MPEMTDLSRVGVFDEQENAASFLKKNESTVSISMATPELLLSINGYVRSAD